MKRDRGLRSGVRGRLLCFARKSRAGDAYLSRIVESEERERETVDIARIMKAVTLTLTFLLFFFMQQNVEAIRLGVMNGNVKYKGARIRVGDVITNVAIILNIFPDKESARPTIESNGLRKDFKLAKSNFELRL